jgi:hypothetical protein
MGEAPEEPKRTKSKAIPMGMDAYLGDFGVTMQYLFCKK